VPTHLASLLLPDETRGNRIRFACIVETKPLDVGVRGDALSLGGRLHLLDLHLETQQVLPQTTGDKNLRADALARFSIFSRGCPLSASKVDNLEDES
jgi:hypothetical protein